MHVLPWLPFANEPDCSALREALRIEEQRDDALRDGVFPLLETLASQPFNADALRGDNDDDVIIAS